MATWFPNEVKWVAKWKRSSAVLPRIARCHTILHWNIWFDLNISGCTDHSVSNTSTQWILFDSLSPPYPTAHASYFDLMCLDGYNLNREMYTYFDNGKFSIKRGLQNWLTCNLLRTVIVTKYPVIVQCPLKIRLSSTGNIAGPATHCLCLEPGSCLNIKTVFSDEGFQ